MSFCHYITLKCWLDFLTPDTRHQTPDCILSTSKCLVLTPHWQVKVDTENYLSADKTGGLEILAQKGKIKVDNTLEARLEMISMQILPSMRNKLFGANPSRSELHM